MFGGVADRSQVHERLARWVESTGESQTAVAARLEISAPYLSQLIAGLRWPGRAPANAIERETATWDGGAIRSEEWDAAEVAAKKTEAA